LFSEISNVDVEYCIEDAKLMLFHSPFTVRFMKVSPLHKCTLTYLKYSLEKQEIAQLKQDDKTLKDLTNEAMVIALSDFLQLQLESNQASCVIDLRTSSDFATIHYPNSISFPLKQNSIEDKKLDILEQWRGTHHIILVGYTEAVAHDFGKFLISQNFPYISVLEKGFATLQDIPDILIKK
jgi:rhodanese-related sulfurtransferase